MVRLWLALALILSTARLQAAGFSDMNPGAKAMGMGMAFSAVADDPYAMFFNPAGTANTPYVQAGSSLGRLPSPVGILTFGALTYLRPFDPINTATVGSAYYAERQTNGGDRDVFLFHYAQEIKIPQLPLTKPLKVGGNFKFINVDKSPASGDGHFGAGFDGGVVARSNFGLTGALALTDLTTNVGVPRPTITLGSAFLWEKWLTVAGDLRARSGLTEFYPGLEAAFFQGLLKARMGRGFQLDGIGQVSFGFGVNFSPAILDVAMTFPSNSINRQAGGYQASFNYRFGAPAFFGQFVGSAASQSESLKAEIEKLEESRKALEAETMNAQTNRDIADGQLRVLEKRVRELQDEHRLLQRRKEETDYDLKEAELRKKAAGEPSPPPPVLRKPAPAPAPTWPREHLVVAGDTLRSLSKTYYNDPELWEQIYEANREKIERGLPQEGATLVIPEPKK